MELDAKILDVISKAEEPVRETSNCTRDQQS